MTDGVCGPQVHPRRASRLLRNALLFPQIGKRISTVRGYQKANLGLICFALLYYKAPQLQFQKYQEQREFALLESVLGIFRGLKPT